MRQFDALVQGCVPLIVKVLWTEDPEFGGTLEQPFAEVLPWNAIALHVTRHQIPRLPEILAAVTPEQHRAYLRAAACAWPRLFWMPIPIGHGTEDIEALVQPSAAECSQTCREELQQLQPYDAFGTLMSLLAQRLTIRRAAASSVDRAAVASLADRQREQDVAAATVWSRLEKAWEDGPRQLAKAAWKTPAASCTAVIS